jgi:hypothetical protein
VTAPDSSTRMTSSDPCVITTILENKINRLTNNDLSYLGFRGILVHFYLARSPSRYIFEFYVEGAYLKGLTFPRDLRHRGALGGP